MWDIEFSGVPHPRARYITPKILPPMNLPPASAPTCQFYSWRNYHCAYEVHTPPDQKPEGVPLLLIHPIGVGLSRKFWKRFCQAWFSAGQKSLIYNPDLLGCGESDLPPVAAYPEDWAAQLQHFLQTVIQQPVRVIVQGALFPVAIRLTQLQTQPTLIQELILAGPPAWPLITTASPTWQHRSLWNLLNSPLGAGFYRYARRPEFLRSFSIRQLFADPASVDAEWLEMLRFGAANPASRYAVFSFLAGFWRQDYQEDLANLTPPTRILIGEQATSISRQGKAETPQQRLASYLQGLPQAQGEIIPGRNVLPYEATAEFIRAMVSERP